MNTFFPLSFKSASLTFGDKFNIYLFIYLWLTNLFHEDKNHENTNCANMNLLFYPVSMLVFIICDKL